MDLLYLNGWMNDKEKLMVEFNKFGRIQSETIDSMINRFEFLIAQMRDVGVSRNIPEVNKKLLDSLPSSWNSDRITIRRTTDLTTTTLVDLIAKLRSLQKVKDIRPPQTFEDIIQKLYSPVPTSSPDASRPIVTVNGTKAVQDNQAESKAFGDETRITSNNRAECSQQTPAISDDHKHLCSQACIKTVEWYKDQRDAHNLKIGGFKYQIDEYKKAEKLFKTRIATHHDTVALLNRRLINQDLSLDFLNERVMLLSKENADLKAKLEKNKICVEKLNGSTVDLEKMTGSQVICKKSERLKGIGYEATESFDFFPNKRPTKSKGIGFLCEHTDLSDVPQPFNANYTVLPTYDGRSCPDDIPEAEIQTYDLSVKTSVPIPKPQDSVPIRISKPNVPNSKLFRTSGLLDKKAIENRRGERFKENCMPISSFDSRDTLDLASKHFVNDEYNVKSVCNNSACLDDVFASVSVPVASDLNVLPESGSSTSACDSDLYVLPESGLSTSACADDLDVLPKSGSSTSACLNDCELPESGSSTSTSLDDCNLDDSVLIESCSSESDDSEQEDARASSCETSSSDCEPSTSNSDKLSKGYDIYENQCFVSKTCSRCGLAFHLARHCKNWHKQQLDLQRKRDYSKPKTVKGKGPDTDHVSASSEDDRYRYQKMKRTYKRFENSNLKREPKTEKLEVSPKTVVKKMNPKVEKSKGSPKIVVYENPKVERSKNSHSRIRRRKSNRKPVYTWIPKECSSSGKSSSCETSSDETSSRNKCLSRRIVTFGDFIALLPETVLSRGPVSN